MIIIIPVILALSTISIVWLFIMMRDVLKADLAIVALKCFFIAVVIFIMMLMILNKLINFNCIKL
jgi:hypothetical protein